MTVRIAVNPGNVSEQPPTTAVKQGTAAGCSEALITCCALAIQYQRQARVHDREHADALIAHGLWDRTETQALRWRQFSFTSTWTTRWQWALGVLHQFYPELPGVHDIPDDHWQAGLPEIATACVTSPRSPS